MFKLFAIAAFATIAVPLCALAYTQQDADACTPDAFRLCQAAIPNESRVAQCLAENKSQLSPACKVVFSRPASTTGSAVMDRRLDRRTDD